MAANMDVVDGEAVQMNSNNDDEEDDEDEKSEHDGSLTTKSTNDSDNLDQFSQDVSKEFDSYDYSDTSKETKKLDDNIENLLERLEEFCSLLDMIRVDNDICLKELLERFHKKSLMTDQVYEHVDKLQDFVDVFKQPPNDSPKKSNGRSSSSRRESRPDRRSNSSRERSSSLPRLLASSYMTSSSSDESPDCHLPSSFSNDISIFNYQTPLSRTKSFRVETKNYGIFHSSDLVKGSLLGRGFFGEVYLVTHKETGEKMVLKELYRVEEDAQMNFLKEVAVLRSLSHENVLRFIGVLYKDKKLHLLTEYISGGTLKELVQEMSKPLTWEQRINIAKDIASGVAYLHSMNIIHRDLNSQNCLVRDNGKVVVADFGLARIISSNRRYSNGKRRDRRKRYTVVGNPYWMAPEMMKGKKYDEKVDVFSFGIILCEIIGRVQADPDYLPRSSDFGLNKVVFKEKFCGACPESFWKIAFLCTEVDPERRPPFQILERWFSSMSIHFAMSSSLTIPKELINEIASFSKYSLTSSSSTESIPETRRAPLLTINEHAGDASDV